MQWGYVPKGNTAKVLFPLVFNTLFSISGIQDANAGSAYELKTQNMDNTGFEQNSYQGKYGSLGWISLGVQQWGYSTARTATFPIAFTSYVYAAVGCPDTNYTSATATGVHSLTLTGLGIVMHGTKGWYFVIGKQQWGRSTNSSGHTDTFPVSFESNCYSITFCNDQGVHYNVNCSISSFTKPSVTWYTNCNGHYITIGHQQWGSLYIPKDQKLQFVYPITFTSTAFAIALSNQGTSNTDYSSAFSDLTNSSVYLADNSATVHCIIVGMQQWGDFVSNLNLEHTHSFPLSASNCIASFWVLKDTNTFAMYRFVAWNGSTLSFVEHRYTNAHYMTNCTLFVVCIQQWSVTAITHPIKWTFSISFSSIPYFIGSIKQGKNDNWTPSYPVSIGSFSKTYVNLRPLETVNANDKLLYNFAIGYQQWGQVKNAETTYSFPVAFTSGVFSFVTTGNGEWSNDWFKQIVKNVTTTTFWTSYGGDKAIPALNYYIALGIQQWGFSTNPVTYPIAFNEKTLLVCGLTFDLQSSHSPNVYQNLTTKTGFPWERYTGVGTYKVSYISFGYQQWGLSSTTQSRGKTGDWAFPNSRQETFTFPLAASTTLAIIPMCKLETPTSSNPSINMGAFYRDATGTQFIHYSSISWEQTVTWKACYVALCVQQWGHQGLDNTTSYNMTVQFPVAHTSKVFSIVGYHQQNSGSAFASGWLYIEHIDLSSFRMKWRNNMYWVSIGI